MRIETLGLKLSIVDKIDNFKPDVENVKPGLKFSIRFKNFSIAGPCAKLLGRLGC